MSIIIDHNILRTCKALYALVKIFYLPFRKFYRFILSILAFISYNHMCIKIRITLNSKNWMAYKSRMLEKLTVYCNVNANP